MYRRSKVGTCTIVIVNTIEIFLASQINVDTSADECIRRMQEAAVAVLEEHRFNADRVDKLALIIRDALSGKRVSSCDTLDVNLALPSKSIVSLKL